MFESPPIPVSLIAEESGTVDRQVQPEMVDKGRRLIQFLAAAQRLRLAPVRTVEAYRAQDGAVLWLVDTPDHPAVTTGGGGVARRSDQ